MKKFGILLHESNTGNFVVLGIKMIEGSYVLTQDKDAAPFLIDNMRMVDEARLSKGDGSLYFPVNKFDSRLLQVAYIETKVVIANVTPVKYVDLNSALKAS